MERVNSLVRLPVRRVDAHKGHFGRVLVVGGSRGMVGAPALAAHAALRGGAGLATMAVPAPIQQTVAGLCVCVTSIPLAASADDVLSPAAVDQFLQACDSAKTLAVGPGLGTGADRDGLISAAISQAVPLVLDADGLTVLARMDGWRQRIACPMILTPHPGEFARLTSAAVGASADERETAAVAFARSVTGVHPFVVLLKGAGTVVTDGSRVYTNTTGNPGMATGGVGDVLTGLIAAFIAQGIGAFEAACLGAHVHGRAGDLAADAIGQASMTAQDVLAYLPEAVSEIAD